MGKPSILKIRERNLTPDASFNQMSGGDTGTFTVTPSTPFYTEHIKELTIGSVVVTKTSTPIEITITFLNSPDLSKVMVGNYIDISNLSPEAYKLEGIYEIASIDNTDKAITVNSLDIDRVSTVSFPIDFKRRVINEGGAFEYNRCGNTEIPSSTKGFAEIFPFLGAFKATSLGNSSAAITRLIMEEDNGSYINILSNGDVINGDIKELLISSGEILLNLK